MKARFRTAMIEWSKASGLARFHEDMNGSSNPQGLDAKSAAVALKAAFPDVTKLLTLEQLTEVLEVYAETDYKMLCAGMREEA